MQSIYTSNTDQDTKRDIKPIHSN